jgi:hypothetical protein
MTERAARTAADASAAYAEQARAASSDDQSLARLLGELIGDAQHLVRREIDLAKQEVRTEVDHAKQGAIALGIGAAITALGGVLLLLMLVYALHEGLNLTLWLSYLIVGGITAIIGAILLWQGINKLQHIDPVPHETIDSVRKDVEWISQQTTSDKT